jgi:hypothetical protein
MSLGRRGLPTGRDFQRQNRRNPLRCHRISVSGLTTTKALRPSNHWLRKPINQRVESSARCGRRLRSRNKASCLRRNKFSASTALLDLHVRTTSRRESKSTRCTVRIKCRDAFNHQSILQGQSRSARRVGIPNFMSQLMRRPSHFVPDDSCGNDRRPFIVMASQDLPPR